MAKKRKPQNIKAPRMTPEEIQMWKEYAQARKTESPQSALRIWARKYRRYKIKLLGTNRIGLNLSYRAGTSAAAPSAGVAAQSCSQICGIRSFERWSKGPTMNTVLKCTLDTCEWNTELKSWVCYYQCISAIRIK